MGKYITLNSNYVLKPDEGRTLILSSLVGRNKIEGVDDSVTFIIHPIYAMILSFIDGREYDECIIDASNELGVAKELIEGFVQKLLDNPSQVYIKSNDKISAFPPQTIITISSRELSKRYNPEMFRYEDLDLRMKRHYTPSTITLMLNNICVTKCIYCYQDKSRIAKCEIPLERIKELIHEARDLNVNTFDVIGGEFFLYKYWKEVLSELITYGYNPYLSTKIPLSEENIKFLAQVGVKDLQVSLDTLIIEHLVPSLGVPNDYANNMINSLMLLEKYKIPIMVHSVLTKYNDSIEDMESIYNVLKNLSNIIDWHVVKGEPSLYSKVNYSNFEIKAKALNSIVDYLESINRNGCIDIRIPTREPENKNISSETERNIASEVNQFFDRSFCSGLFSSLYILPNGQVTMCEQLYWNKNFIVGNVLENSIQEVWNSEKAKSIYFIKQEDIPSDSLCHTCTNFNVCREVRQVCYREIIKKYGTDKWYYPDVNCPYVKIKN
jgi:radical SAM protein with 4Fe4S-binding SPASM domain